MPYRLISDDPDPEQVRGVTLLLLLPEGGCVVPADGGSALARGEVAADEHWLLDTAPRVPLQTHGFRIQGVHPVAVGELDPAAADSGLQVYGFATGAPERDGEEMPRKVPLEQLTPDRLAARLAAVGEATAARFVIDAAEAWRNRTDDHAADDNLRWQAAYLRSDTPWGQSGNSGTFEDWERSRRPVADAIERDGTFLDVGCANGYLMECVHAWCAERGLAVEPYGVELGAELVQLARKRLPQWADRLWVGNMQTWVPPDGLRFDALQVRPDAVLPDRRPELLRRLREHVLVDGGRLIVTLAEPGPLGTAPALLEHSGLTIAGSDRHVAWADV